MQINKDIKPYSNKIRNDAKLNFVEIFRSYLQINLPRITQTYNSPSNLDLNIFNYLNELCFLKINISFTIFFFFVKRLMLSL